ncbi:hypothetical protein [Nannocystis pusilla]|uniref:hypothetical protein n=1 Tax=Nannocystis pusilla TaxID=889268 RepID=UPI003B75E6BF
MTAALRHRGPDGDGVHLEPDVGLGHRRLAILDLAGSPQPMVDASGDLVIVYNGEIYNFAALRAELQAAGVPLRTRGDTEVLLELWRREGPAALQRLRGMFAFAVWDRRTRELHLVRDRLGQKPLYYSQVAGVCCCSRRSRRRCCSARPSTARSTSPRSTATSSSTMSRRRARSSPASSSCRRGID